MELETCIELLGQVRKGIHDFANNIFNMLDVNGDGYVDRNELKAQMEQGFKPLPPDLCKGMDREAQIAKFFEVVQPTREGQISKEELVMYFEELLNELEETRE